MKTKMNNKMFKVFLMVAAFATMQVPALRAQETSSTEAEVSFVYSSGAPMEIGDTVMIHQDSLRYLTGERMSKWVYGVPHQIRQLGTKTKPTGVLLRGIYSWIAQGSLIPLNVAKTQEAMDAKRAAEAAAAAAEAERLAAEAAAAEAERLAAEAAAAEAAARAKMLQEQDTLPPAPQPYQVDRFTIGVRGGLASLMPQTEPAIGSTWGFGVMLDLQYAHYWAKGEDKTRLGILTGLNVGYLQNEKTLKKITENYTLGSGNNLTDYRINIEGVSTLNRQVQVEVPVMFSMITKGGFFLNAGPKFVLPVYTSYNQTLNNVTIQATDLETGVVMTDNIVMGVMKDDTRSGKNNHQFKLGVTVGGEFGYEHALASGHSISIGLYANYGVYNMYKHAGDLNADPSSHSIVTITPPTANGIATVEPQSMFNAYVNKLGYLDAGLKVAFNLNWKK